MLKLATSGIGTFLCFAIAACAGGDTGTAPAADPGDGTPPGGQDASLPPAPASPAPDAGWSAAPPDAGAVDAAPTGPLTAAECFKNLIGAKKGPDYDQFHPTILPSCAGTHHQTISGVEKLVFFGDSVTEGTPPTPIWQYFRSILSVDLLQKYPGLEVADCAAWGARMDDLLEGKGEVAKCFPNAVEPKKSLIVMTNGGNDISSWAKDKLSAADAIVQADKAIAYLRDALTWLKDPVRFPAGSYVVFTNVYEYTDTSGELDSCPTASLSGISGNWSEGAPAVVHFQEQLMKAAVDSRSDLVFLFETFCGHGYKRDDPTLQCYSGPNTDLWFDLTCIHPNPTGHAQIAKLFEEVIWP